MRRIRPAVQTRLAAYQAAYHGAHDMVGASSFDAFMVLALAIKRAGTTNRQAVIAALKATAD